MAKLTPVNPQFPPLINALKNNKLFIKNSLSTEVNQRVTNNLQVNDFVDLTDDYQCFVCNRVITGSLYSLARAVTDSSKIYIVQKLGELVGKSYIIIVSEDDYVCQSCMDIFNKLDNLETELKDTKTKMLKLLEQTYFTETSIENNFANNRSQATDGLVIREQDKSNLSNRTKVV